MADVTVSDHALVRWLERDGVIEMDYFRNYIASLVDDAVRAGAVNITIDGFTYAIDTKTKTLVTVLEHDWRPKKVKLQKTLPERKYGDRDDMELSYLDIEDAE